MLKAADDKDRFGMRLGQVGAISRMDRQSGGDLQSALDCWGRYTAFGKAAFGSTRILNLIILHRRIWHSRCGKAL